VQKKTHCDPRRSYKELGNEPSELIQILPIDGGWDNALSYEITREDKTKTWILRRDMDDNNNGNIKASLSQFSK